MNFYKNFLKLLKNKVIKVRILMYVFIVVQKQVLLLYLEVLQSNSESCLFDCVLTKSANEENTSNKINT